MDRCTVTLAETGDLQPLIIGALRSPGVSAAVAGSTNPHPLPVIIRAWSAVEAALEKTLDPLDATVKQQDESKGASAALDAYREFLYRAAEFVEAVEKQTRAVAGSYKVPMCHYGMRTWPGQHRGAVMLCGHSHGRLPGSRSTLDVGVNNVGFAPVDLPNILARMAALPKVAYDEGRPLEDEAFEPPAI